MATSVTLCSVVYGLVLEVSGVSDRARNVTAGSYGGAIARGRA